MIKLKKTFYITTPIYYPSGDFHIGTAVTTLICDALARYKRLNGYDVLFVTGMDEHGQKIQEVAEKMGLTPQEHVDNVAKQAQLLWKKLAITNDDFIRTTEKRHQIVVEKVFQQFLKNGDIYLDKYRGHYCVPCESYFTENQLEAGQCPSCGREVIWMEEESYFFNMKKYAKQLMDCYEQHPDFILPEFRKNELLNNFIKPGLEDLAVSRSTFDWGIKVPGDPKHIMYVWIDALFNYLSVLGYNTDNNERYLKYWPANVQIVGKDIIRFHGIYWPIFLMALGIELPEHIYAHGFYLMKDSKISKSKGKIIKPEDLISRYGLDATRYYILSALPYAQDGNFTAENFIEKFNYELCNDLGNLLNRSIGMMNKYVNGKVISTKIENNEIISFVLNQIKEVHNTLDKFELANSLSELWKIVRRTNKFIEESEPWVLYKNNDSENLEKVMYILLENLNIIASLLDYYMPETANNIRMQLGITQRHMLEAYNSTKTSQVTDNPQPIFLRLDMEKELNYFNQLLKN